MKAIILEIRSDEAVILSDNGDVSKIKNKNYKIGQEIIMKKDKNINSKFIKKVAGIAAVFAITAVSGFAYATPTSYVSLDVNPSIEYSLNTFNRVLSVTAVNKDGEKIVVDLDVKNKEITDAVQETVDKLIEGGYITDDENAGVIIAISNSDEDKAGQLAENLQEDTQEYINEKGETAKVEAEAVGKARVEEARELGVTPGKLNLVEKLIASSSDSDKIVKEDWLNKSVKEINKAIKENRAELKAAKTTSDDQATDSTENVVAEDNETAADIDQNNEQKVIKEKNKIQNENKPIKDAKVSLQNKDDLDDENSDSDIDSDNEDTDQNNVVKTNNSNNSNSQKSENSKK